MSTASSKVNLSRLIRRPPHQDGRFPHVDSLRAFAALSIVVFHFAGYMPLPEQMSWFGPVAVRLGAGVLVFFVISGFLIYRPFVRANLDASARPESTAYAKRRFLRIVPAYFLALTLTAVLVGKTDVFGSDGFLYYGFAQVYKPGLELKGLSVAWSLCIEVTLYAFLPIWAWLVAQIPARTKAERHQRELITLVLLLVGGIVLRFLLENNQGRVDTISILAYLDVFALGMVLAYFSVAWEGRQLPSWLDWLNDRPGIAWFAAAVCIWAMAAKTGPNRSAFQAATSTDLWLRHGLSAAVGVLLLLPLAFGDQTRGMLRRFLSHPILLWAGVVSYGLYLFHPVVLRKLDDAGAMPDSSTIANWWGMLLLVVAITALLAAASWHFLERPILELKDSKFLSPSRPVLPAGPRVAIGLGGAALMVAGLDGTGYDFIDFVMAVSGGAILLGVALPTGQPRPATGLLAGVGVVAMLFALIPGILTLTRPEIADASSTPFPQRAFLTGVSSDGKLRIYLNGKLVATGDGPAKLGASKVPFEIGGVKGNQGWSGAIDDVAVWNRALPESMIKAQFALGSQSGGKGLESVMKMSDGLVRWYRLGDVTLGAKDSVNGTIGKKVGSVAQSTGHVAMGDADGGALKVLGNGRISTPPLLRVNRDNMTVSAWVQTGSSISNRVIMGAANAWLLRTDIAGHWSFGVKEGKDSYTVLAPQAAQRFVPGAAAQAKALGSSDGISVLGVFAALLAAGGALLMIPSVRERMRKVITSVSKR